MLGRTALRSATQRATAAARPAPRASHHWTAPPHRRQLGKLACATVVATATVGVAYTLYELKPEAFPTVVTPLLAEAASAAPGPSTQVFVDPTTSTPFPHRLVAPDGKTHLRLVGTGVRTVSFLNIRVYAAAFYVSEPELEAALAGKLAGWEAYAPERLIPLPLKSTAGNGAGELLRGEQLMDTLLEKADTAVVIIPLRNTSLAHLRDGFSRALVARLKNPRVADDLSAASGSSSEATGAALVDFKSFFPNKNLAKGMPLELYYSAKNREVTFQLRNEKTRSPEILGTLRDPVLSRELMLSYFSDSAAPSYELVKSVALGMARGPGSPTAIAP